MIRGIIKYLLALLTIGFVLLWSRSYWKHDELSIWKMPYSFYVNSSLGQFGVSLGFWHEPRDRERAPEWETQLESWNVDFAGPIIDDRDKPRLIFKYGSFAAFNNDSPRWRAIGLVVPFWFISVFLALATWLAWKPGRKSRADKTCKHCGYDLRASEGRCPECGALIDAKKPQQLPNDPDTLPKTPPVK
ncbi:MAG TPA: zinc ribbon domain-containing protein [Phycisphaerae bacterium]|nr:zinc ribbon domain-containing protein [Phycisphaerae bacterium]